MCVIGCIVTGWSMGDAGEPPYDHDWVACVAEELVGLMAAEGVTADVVPVTNWGDGWLACVTAVRGLVQLRLYGDRAELELRLSLSVFADERIPASSVGHAVFAYADPNFFEVTAAKMVATADMVSRWVAVRGRGR